MMRDIIKGVAVVVIGAGILWGVRKIVKHTVPSLLND